jgi:tetratricopeptide (TPR) repeat protein
MLGWSWQLSGKTLESLSMLRETYEFSQEIANLWGEAESAWRLAGAYLESGEFGKAIMFARQGGKQAQIVGQPTMIELALTTMGMVQRTMMALGPARETLSEVVARSNERGRAGYADWALSEVCAVHALADDWKEANALAKKALRMRSEKGLLPLGLTGWYEIEALLRGDDALTRAELKRLEAAVGSLPRYRLMLQRCQAVMAQWDGDLEQATAHLRSATTLAKEIGLPGEAWSILASLGDLYRLRGDQSAANRARRTAAEIILGLAETIDEDELRRSFVEASAIRAILDGSESG